MTPATAPKSRLESTFITIAAPELVLAGALVVPVALVGLGVIEVELMDDVGIAVEDIAVVEFGIVEDGIAVEDPAAVDDTETVDNGSDGVLVWIVTPGPVTVPDEATEDNVLKGWWLRVSLIELK